MRSFNHFLSYSFSVFELTAATCERTPGCACVDWMKVAKLTGHILLINKLFHNFYIFWSHYENHRVEARYLPVVMIPWRSLLKKWSLCCVLAACAFLLFFIVLWWFYLMCRYLVLMMMMLMLLLGSRGSFSTFRSPCLKLAATYDFCFVG